MRYHMLPKTSAPFIAQDAHAEREGCLSSRPFVVASMYARVCHLRRASVQAERHQARGMPQVHALELTLIARDPMLSLQSQAVPAPLCTQTWAYTGFKPGPGA